MKIKIITLDQPAKNGTKVLIDGVEVDGVTNITFTHPVGEMARLTLEILPQYGGIEIEGGAVVHRLPGK